MGKVDSFDFDIKCIVDRQIKECLETLNKVGKKRHLGIKRWDYLMDTYDAAGSVLIPVKMGWRVFKDPFYFMFEKVNDKECLFIKPIEGDPYPMGDVYGFFGLYAFGDYRLGQPIILVEGRADWAALKNYYRYVLVAGRNNLSERQMFFIKNLTRDVYIGFDGDEAGARGRGRVEKFFDKIGVKTSPLIPIGDIKQDWGRMVETDWGKKLLGEIMNNVLENILGHNG